ncbi:MAG TPA: CbrC family protein [Paludibaculum sp.]|jgi:hypothetical protein
MSCLRCPSSATTWARVRTGGVIESPPPCLVCNQARGYLYDGPIYTEDDPQGAVCTWCIAGDSAAGHLTAIDEIATRTPGHSPWQSEV